MKKTGFIIFLFVVIASLDSCTIEKRHYRGGYYVSWNRHVVHPDSGVNEEPYQPESTATFNECVTDTTFQLNNETGDAQSETKVNSETIAEKSDDRITDVYESPDSHAERNDEPLPEGHDKINPLLGWLIGSGIVLSSLWLVLNFVTIPGSAWLAFVILPLLGVLLFTLAFVLRKRYLESNMMTHPDKPITLSAHYHRFRILLLLFFASALMVGIGWLLALVGSFSVGAGFLGVILGGGGMILLQGVLAVLVVMFLIYLFLWRKDPTGIRPPRNPHPPKDH